MVTSVRLFDGGTGWDSYIKRRDSSAPVVYIMGLCGVPGTITCNVARCYPVATCLKLFCYSLLLMCMTRDDWRQQESCGPGQTGAHVCHDGKKEKCTIPWGESR